MSANYNLKTTRGDTLNLTVVYKANGQVVDLTGYIAQMVIAWVPPRGVQVVDGERITPGNIVVNGSIIGAEGKLVFNLSAEDSLELPKLPDLMYQVRLTAGPDTSVTILKGNISVDNNWFETGA